MGFKKLFDSSKENVKYQIRGEMVQTSNSISHMVRDVFISVQGWHMHGEVLGFKNHGQYLGLNQAIIGNLQIIEISRVRGIQKIGVMLERTENNKDFFLAAFSSNPHNRPWIDFSAALLLTRQFGPVLADIRLQSIHAYNYQWAWNHPKSSNPVGKIPSRTDFLIQWQLYYLIPTRTVSK